MFELNWIEFHTRGDEKQKIGDAASKRQIEHAFDMRLRLGTPTVNQPAK